MFRPLFWNPLSELPPRANQFPLAHQRDTKTAHIPILTAEPNHNQLHEIPHRPPALFPRNQEMTTRARRQKHQAFPTLIPPKRAAIELCSNVHTPQPRVNPCSD